VKDVAEPDEVLQIDRFVQAELLVEDRLGFGRGAETEDDVAGLPGSKWIR